jgi:hypothetical protein
MRAYNRSSFSRSSPDAVNLHFVARRREHLHHRRRWWSGRSWRTGRGGNFKFNCVRSWDSAAFGEPADDGGHVGPRRQLGDELLDPAFGAVGGASENALVVGGGEVGRELRRAAQMETPVGDHLEQERKLPRGTGNADAEIG